MATRHMSEAETRTTTAATTAALDTTNFFVPSSSSSLDEHKTASRTTSMITTPHEQDMTARKPRHRSPPTEEWDDDFEFSHSKSRFNDKGHEAREEHDQTPVGGATHAMNVTIHDDHALPSTGARKNSSRNTQPSSSSHKDAKAGPSRIHEVSSVFTAPSPFDDRLDLADPLSAWRESSEPVGFPRRGIEEEAENWDDDFLDKTDSPAGHRLRTPAHQRLPSSLSAREDVENWDEELGLGSSDSPTPNRIASNASWHSSDEENDDEFGFADKEQEDKTITAKTRPMTKDLAPPVPPLPPMPLYDPSQPQPMPRSPTLSAFSIPASGRESVTYGSTAHLALRPTTSAGSSRLAMLPPSPPVHRERRRLRKKSRPPHFDGNIIELEDRPEFQPIQELNILPMVAGLHLDPRPSTPPPTTFTPLNSDLPVPNASPSRSPLLARIGSVKRWTIRRPRASTGPAEVLESPNNDSLSSSEGIPTRGSTQPSTPSQPKPTIASRFFRGGGGGHDPPISKTDGGPALKKEKSRYSLVMRQTAAEDIAEKLRREGAVNAKADVGVDTVLPRSKSKQHLPQRRPSSLQVNKTPFPRHASSSAVEREEHRAVPDVPRSVSASNSNADSHGGFMNGVRRISFGSGGTRRHRRVQSSGTKELENTMLVPPLPPLSRTSDETSSSSNPKSPVELSLSPPSPPRNSPAPPHGDKTPTRRSVDAMRKREHKRTASLTTTSSAGDVAATLKPGGAYPPQAASLGRSAINVVAAGSGITPPRRNSLGDLKIPSRISRVQINLKQDLNRVKEFAAHVEELKVLRQTYSQLINQIDRVVQSPAPSPSPQSPSHLFGLGRPPHTGPGRARSNTNPLVYRSNLQTQRQRQDLITAFYVIDNKYRLTWECADLLVELGSGTGKAEDSGPATSSVSAPTLTGIGRGTPRGRAVTLGGNGSIPGFHPELTDTDQQSTSKAEATPENTAKKETALASPPSLSWRASTGRHDLSVRQLRLLKEMLNSGDSAAKAGLNLEIESEIEERQLSYRHPRHHWQWGQGMDSAITLPSEPSEDSVNRTNPDPEFSTSKKRRSSRMRMKGLRDMLRSLKRDRSKAPSSKEQVGHDPEVRSASRNMESRCSTAMGSIEADSSMDSHQHAHNLASRHPRPDPFYTTGSGRRRAKTSADPETLASKFDSQSHRPFMRGDRNGSISALAPAHRSSPRRPSLASLFRLGQQKHKVPSSTTNSETDHSANSHVNGSSANLQHINATASNASLTEFRQTEGAEGEEEWDRMDDARETGVAFNVRTGLRALPTKASLGTLRSRKQQHAATIHPSTSQSRQPVTPRRLFSASQLSFWEPPKAGDKSPVVTRASKLSNVDENAVHQSSMLDQKTIDLHGLQTLPPRPTSAHSMSVPMQSLAMTSRELLPRSLSESNTAKLAMTPENIRPLLENAREVTARLNNCVSEVRELLAQSS